jgi:hypothetical protein
VPVGTPCPECGTLRRPEPNPTALAHADDAFLKRLRLGATLMRAAYLTLIPALLVLIGAIVALTFIETDAADTPAEQAINVVLTVVGVAVLCGFLLVFVAHVPLSAREFDVRRSVFERLYRWSTVAALPTVIAAFAFHGLAERQVLPGTVQPVVNAATLAAGVALAGLFVTANVHQRRLARRADPTVPPPSKGLELLAGVGPASLGAALILGITVLGVSIGVGAGALAIPLLLMLSTMGPALVLRRRLRRASA